MNTYVPLAPVPAQTLSIILDNQNAQIAVRQRGDALYLDLSVDDAPIIVNKICRDRIRLLLASSYKGFRGDLVFVDTKGDTQPEYSGLGDRYVLLYLSQAEITL